MNLGQKLLNQIWENQYLFSYSVDIDGNQLTSLYQLWENGMWQNQNLNSATYDENGNTLTYLSQKWQNQTWENFRYTVYTYNSTGGMLSKISQIWEDSLWINKYRHINTFDSAGRLISELYQNWYNDNWLNSQLITNVYEGSLSKYLIQLWEEGSWKNFYQDVKETDTLNNWMTSTSSFWEDSVWVSSICDSLVFDTFGNNILFERLIWNADSSNWLKDLKLSFTYDIFGNLLSDLKQIGINSEWENYFFKVYTYNENNRTTTFKSQQWIYQQGIASWVDIDSTTYEYAFDGNYKGALFQQWNGSYWENKIKTEYEYFQGLIKGYGYKWFGGTWVPGDSPISLELYEDGIRQVFHQDHAFYAETYYSSINVGNSDLPIQPLDDLFLYPNPVSGILHIRFTLDRQESVRLKLLDSSGKAIRELWVGILNTGTHTLTLQIQDYSPGLYYLESSVAKTKRIRKVIINH